MNVICNSFYRVVSHLIWSCLPHKQNQEDICRKSVGKEHQSESEEVREKKGWWDDWDVRLRLEELNKWMMSWDDRKALFYLISLSHCTPVGRLGNRQAPGKLKPWNLHITDSNETREVVVGATGGDLLCYWDGAIAKGVSLYGEEKRSLQFVGTKSLLYFLRTGRAPRVSRLFKLVINHWMQWLNWVQIRRIELLTILGLEKVINGFYEPVSWNLLQRV
jgi:hypothetical protein